MVREHRKRYVVVHVKTPEGVGKGLLINLIRGKTRDLPEEEFNKIKPWFVYYQSGWAIIRSWHRGTRSLVRLIEELNGKEMKEGTLQINIAGVAGTLRSAFYKYIPEVVRDEKHYREDLPDR
jgi:RNase P/RNase MRP subunit POP5